MESLFDNETMSLWLVNYGSVALFFLLALGVFALPIPDETLMILSGILMFKGHLPIHSTILSSYAGSMCGITLSYLFGRTAGSFIIHRYGRWFGLTEEHLQKAHNWFERFGKWTLVIGYFIPGIRHLTGFSAGTTELEYRQFALFAYTGALLWATVFLSIGYFLGDYFLTAVSLVEIKTEYIIVTLAALIIGYCIYRYKR